MRTWTGNQTVSIRTAAAAKGGQVKVVAFIGGTTIGTDDRFELNPGQSLKLKCVGLLEPEVGRPHIIELLLWQESAGQEIKKKDPKKAIQVLPGHDSVLFDGDVEVTPGIYSATLSHRTTQGENNPAHYRFSVRLKDFVSGKTIDWDPDVHDKPPKG